MSAKTSFNGSAGERGDLPRGKYASPDLPAEQDSRSVYFPDAMIDSFVQEANNIVPRTVGVHIARPEEFDLLKGVTIAEPHISVEEAKVLIIHTLTEFDPEMGRRAADILNSVVKDPKDRNDPGRLNLHERDGVMMRVRAKGSTMPDDHPMSFENAASEIWPNLTEEERKNRIAEYRELYPYDDNPSNEDHPAKGPQAVIDFDYNGSIGSVIYLAHELGHALADDSQIAAGHSYRDNPEHMQETQAYLVQNIVLDRLRAHENPEIATAANRSYAADMTRNLYDLSLSMAAKDALDAFNENRDINPAHVFEERFGKNWEQFIQQDEAALNVFEAISNLPISTDEQRPKLIRALQDEFTRIHFRPMAIMTGSAFASHLWNQNLQTRSTITETVFGGYGPKKIEDALQIAGINDQEKIQALAHSTIQQSISSLQPDHRSTVTPPISGSSSDWTLEA